MLNTPTIEHHYQNVVMDSARWARFSPRHDDVVVCTSYKAGTTWTQMICALIIHGELPAPLAELSPWLDMRVQAIDDIVALLERQAHRRVIKTHTGLDGLPYNDQITYMVCGRDPRDVFMSLQNHMANADPMQFAKLLTEQGVAFEPPPALPDDINDRFRLWITTPTFPWESDGLPYWSHFRHAETFWKHRDLPNIHFLHYEDLVADLEGQMKRVAAVLGVEVAPSRWPALVKAATFAEMKSNADRTAPDAHNALWLSNSQFFNKGRSGQWRGVLNDASLKLYDEVTRARYDPRMLDWLERGALVAGDPKAT
jgi:aryl sulfotransferase